MAASIRRSSYSVSGDVGLLDQLCFCCRKPKKKPDPRGSNALAAAFSKTRNAAYLDNAQDGNQNDNLGQRRSSNRKSSRGSTSSTSDPAYDNKGYNRDSLSPVSPGADNAMNKRRMTVIRDSVKSILDSTPATEAPPESETRNSCLEDLTRCLERQSIHVDGIHKVPIDEVTRMSEMCKEGQTNPMMVQQNGSPGTNEVSLLLQHIDDTTAQYLNKRQYVIKELADTEKVYVEDLRQTIEGYLRLTEELNAPGVIKQEDLRAVFGNVQQIYEWHKGVFLQELEECAVQPNRIGDAFAKHEKKLRMYVKYCENKPKSEVITGNSPGFFRQIQTQLNYSLPIQGMLIKPVQRIMKYQLLLKDILKYTDKAGGDTRTLHRAYDIMCLVPKAADDMMTVAGLKMFPEKEVGRLTAQGKLLLQGRLNVLERSDKLKREEQRFRECQVFIFEQIIIISETLEKPKDEFSSATYLYKRSLKANKIALKEHVHSDPLEIILFDKTPRSDLRIILHTKDHNMKLNWICKLREMIDMQRELIEALSNPLQYHK